MRNGRSFESMCELTGDADPLDPRGVVPRHKREESSSVSRSVTSGATRMMAASGLVRALSLGSQAVLGLLLAREEFGAFAIAVSSAFAGQLLKDVAFRPYLLQAGARRYAHLKRPVFWVVAMASWSVSIILLASASQIAQVYGQPSLQALISLMALSLIPVPGTLIGTVSLQRQLRFGKLASLNVTLGVLKYGATIVLAWRGFGALSFAIPVLLVSWLECFVVLLLSGGIRWIGRPTWGRMRNVWLEAKWSIFGGVASTLPNYIDYMILGFVANVAIVGTYYFAYQATIQAVALIAVTLLQVLTPGFAIILDQGRSLGRPMLRAAAATSVVTGPLLIVIALLAQPMETLVFDGRWRDAVPAIQALCMLLPFPLVASVPDAALQATGRLRRWTVASLMRSAVLPFAVYLTGSAIVSTRDVVWLALAVGGSLVVGSLAFCALSMPVLGVTTERFFWRTFRGPLISAGLGGMFFLSAPAKLVDNLPGSLVMAVTIFALYFGVVRIVDPLGVRDLVSALPPSSAIVAKKLLRV